MLSSPPGKVELAAFPGYFSDSTTAGTATTAAYYLEITATDSTPWPFGTASNVSVTRTKADNPFESHQEYLDRISDEKNREGWVRGWLPEPICIKMHSYRKHWMPMNCRSRTQVAHQKRKSRVQKIRREIG